MIIPGDLILSYENTFFSKLVRMVTKSKWSHVSIYVGDCEYNSQQHTNTTISAAPIRGVSFYELSRIKYYDVYRVKNITEENRAKVIKFCIEKLGKKYDYTQIILLAYRIITDSMNKNKGDALPESYVCSELIAEAYASVGICFGKIIDNVIPDVIAKSDLVELVQN